MTAKTIDDQLASLYQSEFVPQKFTPADECRIAFLTAVVSGKTILSYKLSDVVSVTRAWYLDPRNAGYLSIREAVENSGHLGIPVADELDKCLKILRTYRLDELVGEFETEVKSYAQARPKERSTIVKKVDHIIAQVTAFHDPDTIDRIVDIGQTYASAGLYPASKRQHAKLKEQVA